MTQDAETREVVPEWVKGFLDHMRTTCIEDRQRLKEENRWLWATLRDTYADLQQMVPGMSKPYVEAKLASQSDGDERGPA
jgi:hypothetical protein